MAARLTAANDNKPLVDPRRYAGRRGELLRERLMAETGIYLPD